MVNLTQDVNQTIQKNEFIREFKMSSREQKNIYK